MADTIAMAMVMSVVTLGCVMVALREIGKVWQALHQHRDTMAEVARSVYHEERIKERLED